MYKTLFFLTIALIISSCNQKKQPQIIDTGIIAVNATVNSQNNEMSQWIAPYKKTLGEAMDIPLGVAAVKMTAGRPESLLGTLITTAMRDYADKHGKSYDCAITNIGGIRDSIMEGEMTVGTIYSVFPFDNEFVILTISGKKMAELCQIIARQGGQVTDGIKMIIDKKLRTGNNVKINNLPIDTNRNYKILTTDYLAFGNDFLFPMADYSEFYSFKVPLRDAIIDYIKNQNKMGKKINPILKNEVIIGNL